MFKRESLSEEKASKIVGRLNNAGMRSSVLKSRYNGCMVLITNRTYGFRIDYNGELGAYNSNRMDTPKDYKLAIQEVKDVIRRMSEVNVIGW